MDGSIHLEVRAGAGEHVAEAYSESTTLYPPVGIEKAVKYIVIFLKNSNANVYVFAQTGCIVLFIVFISAILYFIIAILHMISCME